MKPQQKDAADRAALTAIWRQVLRNDDVDENSDLFEHGGTSLHVLQIVGAIYDSLGLDIRPRHVFLHASPQGLATFLEQESGESADSREPARS